MAGKWRLVVFSLAVGIILGVPGAVAVLYNYPEDSNLQYPSGSGPPTFSLTRRQRVRNVVAIFGLPGATIGQTFLPILTGEPHGVQRAAQAYEVVVPCNVAFYMLVTWFILQARRVLRRTPGQRQASAAPDHQRDNPDDKSNTVG